MRFLFIIGELLLLVFLTGCQNDSFSIKGDLHQVNATKAYLIHTDPVRNTINVLDSSEVHEGHFSFHGRVDYPIACNIKIGRRTTINLIVENSTINISGSAQIPEEIKISGSKSDADFQNLLLISENIGSLKNEIWANMMNQNNGDSLNTQFVSIEDSLLSATAHFVRKNPTSVGAAYFVYYLYLDRLIEMSKLDGIISLFDNSISDSEYLQYLKKEKNLIHPLQVGDVAPDFKVPSIRSDSVFSLSTFNGKYLYVDFSASWLKLFKKRTTILSEVKDSIKPPFEIVTVYLDGNKETLQKNISNIYINWHQCCSFDYWEGDITKSYAVNKLPFGVLINPQGKIIAIDPQLTEINNYIEKR